MPTVAIEDPILHSLLPARQRSVGNKLATTLGFTCEGILTVTQRAYVSAKM